MRLLLLGLLLISSTGHATVYKCIQDGKAIYSDKPCGDNAKEVPIRAAKPAGVNIAPRSGIETVNQNTEQFLQEQQRERTVRELQARISGARARMNEELSNLDKTLNTSPANLQGRTREQRRAEAEQAVRDKYQNQIEQDEKALARLQSE